VIEANAVNCTGCKGKECKAVARRYDCANFLCGNCVMAHQFMHSFEGHKYFPFGELQNGGVKLEELKVRFYFLFFFIVSFVADFVYRPVRLLSVRFLFACIFLNDVLHIQTIHMMEFLWTIYIMEFSIDNLHNAILFHLHDGIFK
jgi:hypothetical protein